jgi:hypothetical protein
LPLVLSPILFCSKDETRGLLFQFLFSIFLQTLAGAMAHQAKRQRVCEETQSIDWNDFVARYPDCEMSLREAFAHDQDLEQWLAQNTRAVAELRPHAVLKDDDERKDEDDAQAAESAETTHKQQLLLLDGMSWYLADWNAPWATFSVKTIGDELSIFATIKKKTTEKREKRFKLRSQDPIWCIDGYKIAVSQLKDIQQRYAQAFTTVSSTQTRVTFHVKENKDGPASQVRAAALEVKDGKLYFGSILLVMGHRGDDLCAGTIRLVIKSLSLAAMALSKLDENQHLHWDVDAMKPC